MDCDIWLNSIAQFTHFCGASNNNNKMLLFSFSNINVYSYFMDRMALKYFHTFVIKEGDSKIINEMEVAKTTSARSFTTYRNKFIMKYIRQQSKLSSILTKC